MEYNLRSSFPFTHDIHKHFTIAGILRILSFFLFLFFLVPGSDALAQSRDELGQIRVDELTDDQVRRFIMEADRLSVKDEQLEQLALQKGMNPLELVKLKDRIRAMRSTMAVSGYTGVKPANTAIRQPDSAAAAERSPLSDFNEAFTALQSRNFGFAVFNNTRLSFEPSFRLPTPKNYQLAADDELLIEVSGYSEASYRLKVSPEGIIRIPVAGPVFVNGLTIEQATQLIVRKLASTIYTNIKTGRTQVSITLGAVRSIKVTIIGEATLPGTFTLPSLASVYNALYACGGPNGNGSFRDIQVIRNSTVAATIDVYQYLMNGTKKNDIRLMEGDIIKINTYNVRIELKGEVKRPGLYDLVQGETLEKVLSYAGGFTDMAYRSKIQVFRNTDRERQVSTITEKQLASLVPKRGDNYIVGKILNRFTNRVSIKGAVYRPGEYELKTGMTLTGLIAEADGFREDAFAGRATLHRLKADLSPEIISFDPEKLKAGSIADIELRREDRVTIYSKFDLKEGYYVQVEGEVANPGFFLYEEGLTVQDLVLMAGGLKEAASLSRVEVSRRIKNPVADSAGAKSALIFQQDIRFDLKDSTGPGLVVLQPFDEVSIHPVPGYAAQKNVVVEGEVLYTGRYTLESKADRISDLVKRSGGLTKDAYLKGAVLVRTRNLSKSEQNNNAQGLANLLKQNYNSGVPVPLLQAQLEFDNRRQSDNLGIDLQKIMDNPLTEYDLFLNDGDTLRIPKQLQTVRVNGEVLYPALVRYDAANSFRDYISGAGGFSDRSSKKRPYVVYANGSVKGTKSFLFFRSYPRLTPGAEIFVPVKRERERLRTGEAITVGATIVTMLAILFSVFRK